MTIQYASDLHLEFPENRDYIKTTPLQPNADILLLAGDIVPFSQMGNHKDFFDYISHNFRETYWIPGNHEYYNEDIINRSGTLNESVRSNVHLINNLTMTIEGIHFIFSTLWSKINPINQSKIERSSSDFHVIQYKGRRFRVEQFNNLHEECLRFVTSALQQYQNTKTVVITHHVPTFMNYPPQYKGDILNEAFAVELIDLIEDIQPDYWIYGHHHTNTPGFQIAKTHLITNQLGYVKYGEHHLFDTGKVIQVG